MLPLSFTTSVACIDKSQFVYLLAGGHAGPPKWNINRIDSSLLWIAYRLHDDAVGGSSREDETKVLCRSHQSSFIWKTSRGPSVEDIY